MPTARASQPRLSSVDIAREHQQLFDGAKADADKIRTDQQARKDFLERYERFVEKIRTWREKHILSHSDSAWLSRAASGWQDLLIELRIDRYVRNDIGLSTSVHELERKILTPGEVCEYLDSKADRIYVERKMQLVKKPSTKSEMDEDWHRAEVCFALEVLEGRVDFANQVGSELYPMLEAVWLEDVKRLKAFLQWEQEGEPLETEGGLPRYYESCSQLSQRAMKPASKAPVEYFEEPADYVEQSYLSDGRVDPQCDTGAGDLIGIKAGHIWQAGQNSNQDEDWSIAESYVKAYYENVLPAVQSGDPEAHAEVCRALTEVNRNAGCDLVNCLEAAMVIYHLDPVQLRKACAQVREGGLF